jgi:hypothetical protein
MTVHMVRVYAAADVPLSQAQSAVDSWLAKHATWTQDTVDHSIQMVEDSDTGTTYFVGDFRFEWAETKDAILDGAEQDLGQSVSWFRIGYHECGHDEPAGGRCVWDDRREAGTVPNAIPALGGGS